MKENLNWKLLIFLEYMPPNKKRGFPKLKMEALLKWKVIISIETTSIKGETICDLCGKEYDGEIGIVAFFIAGDEHDFHPSCYRNFLIKNLYNLEVLLELQKSKNKLEDKKDWN